MPTYNYRCEKCGVLEITQTITEPALENCPQCEGPVKRVIGRNMLVLFKGSGFYCTDSRHSKGAALSDYNDTPSEGESKSDFKLSEVTANQNKAAKESGTVSEAAAK